MLLSLLLPLEIQWITKIKSGKTIGNSTDHIEMTPIKMIAESQSPRTGSVLNNANSLGNAEVPELAREADGAPAMMDVREPHFQCKLQVFLPITESKVI